MPTVISRAAFKLQSKNAGVTEISVVPGRGHSLVIDHGCSDIATIADEFVTRVLQLLRLSRGRRQIGAPPETHALGPCLLAADHRDATLGQ